MRARTRHKRTAACRDARLFVDWLPGYRFFHAALCSPVSCRSHSVWARVGRTLRQTPPASGCSPPAACACCWRSCASRRRRRTSLWRRWRARYRRENGALLRGGISTFAGHVASPAITLNAPRSLPPRAGRHERGLQRRRQPVHVSAVAAGSGAAAGAHAAGPHERGDLQEDVPRAQDPHVRQLHHGAAGACTAWYCHQRVGALQSLLH